MLNSKINVPPSEHPNIGMSEEHKQTYRLSKVVRELNISSSSAVEFLNSKGFKVLNDLNLKLSEEMYTLLLRQFSSDKEQKQKAVQIKEQKQLKTQGEETAQEDESLLSADTLKGSLLGTEDMLASLLGKKEEKPVEETPVVEQEKPTEQHIGLKVVGKIDLDKPKKKKQPEPKVEEPKTVVPEPEVEKTPEPVQEIPVVPAEEPVQEPILEQKPEPVQEPVEVPYQEVTPETETVQPEEVIRAADHTPRLQGLTIKGKIELPAEKKKTRQDSSSQSPAGESAEDKKKRKRKRKRKSASAVDVSQIYPGKKTESVTIGAGKDNKGKKSPATSKDQPTDKEIQDKIKSTLANINQKATRNRQKFRRAKRDEAASRREMEEMERMEQSRILEVTEFITANELASLMNVSVTTIITKCLELGMFVSINQRLEADVISILADEFGYQVKFVDVTEQDLEEEEEEYAAEDFVTRPPIITVMGHVDHGKTSLLDHIRETNVIAGEAGGITQHIGAYEVTLPEGRKITFLDTPGHEAFTAMRARGAKITDVAIIVIAADDSVMPQTREAINHAQAAGVPMVFAFNKIDKPGANVEKIKEQLSQMNILVEDWGGKYQCQSISAKQGIGIKELLDKVLLESDMLDLKAVANKPAKGTIIESRLDKGRGLVATMIVQEGTLKVGDCFVAGIHYGRVKALQDERGNRIKHAGPATPCQLLGLTGAPQAGDKFQVYEEERKAKEVASRRQELFREQTFRTSKHITLEEIARRKAVGDFRELKIIVKGDVDGSVEALSDSLLKISTEEVQVSIIMKGVGQITESDINLASASDAIIIGFQVRPSASARKLAESEQIDIRLYSIIYDAINDVRDALEGMLSPEIKEDIVATIEVREAFRISKVGTIAGCYVSSGKISRNDQIRVIRDGIVIHEGKLNSLKRYKDDVKEVASGTECGLGIESFNDIQAGDTIEAYREREVKRTL